MPQKDRQVHLNLNIKAGIPNVNRATAVPNNPTARSQCGTATSNHVSAGPIPPRRIVIRGPANSQCLGKQLSAVNEQTPDLYEKTASIPSDNSSGQFVFYFF